MPKLSNLKSSFQSFGQDFLHSCYDMEWYRGIRIQPVKKAVKYAAKLLAAMSLFASILLLPALIAMPGGLRNFVQEKLPDGAEFAVTKGVFSTTLESPYVIETDAGKIVIDTSMAGGDARAASDDMIAVVGSEAMVLRNGAAEMRTYFFKDAPDFRVSRQTMLDFAGKWAPVGAVAIWLLALTGGFIGSSVYVGILVLLLALLAHLVARMMRIRVGYSRLVASGLHAITLPVVVDFLFGLAGIRLPYAFSFLTSLLMFAVLADERARPTAVELKT